MQHNDSHIVDAIEHGFYSSLELNVGRKVCALALMGQDYPYGSGRLYSAACTGNEPDSRGISNSVRDRI